MSDVITLETKAKDLHLTAQVTKRWGIINPTNNVIQFKGRGNESGVVPPISNKYVDNNRVYITIVYDCKSIRSNLSLYGDYSKGVFSNTKLDNHIVLSIALKDIEENEEGVYVPDIDLVIGLDGVNLEHPSKIKTPFEIVGKNAIYHQLFLNSTRETGNIWVKFGSVVLEVQCANTGGVPGLYSWISRSGGEEIALIDPAPLFDKDRDKIIASQKENKFKSTGIECKLFTELLDRAIKVAKVGKEYVADDLKEDTNLKKEARGDILDESKMSRQEEKEAAANNKERVSTMRTNTKTAYDIASSISKLI